MPSVLQLRVFLAGRVAVETGSVVIDERRFPGRQGRVVFAYLVVQQGRPVPRDELAEALWGEALPLTWDKALTVIASKLRSLLTDSGVDGSSALTGAFGCYRLELPGGTWVDVVAARRAAQMAEDAFASGDTEKAKREATLAASLLQQPFLPGEDGMWVGETRRDLTGVRARAMSVLADTCLRLGETSEAANWAEQVIALEPFRETGYRRLMDAHVAAGNRAEALRVYERCRRLLAEELGAYPSPETESVYRGLLEGSSAQTAASVAVVRQPPRPPRLGDLDGAIPQRGVSVGGRRPLWGRRAFLAPAAVAVLGVVGIVTVVLAGPPFGSHQTAAGVVAADSLGVFEASGRAIADTAVGTGPHGVAVGAGSIWLTNTDGNSVSRIDPKTNAVVQTIDVTDGPEGVAFGGGFVWVADSLANTVSQIDPGTNTVVRRISVGNGPTGVAFGLHGVWVTDVADRTLVRIDPRTGSAGRPLTVDKGADAVAVGGGSVWVTSGGSPGSVARIDPRADAVVETISVGNDPSAIAAGTGAVWVANTEDGTVSQIDPASNRQTSVIPVGAGPAGIALGREAVWVANELGGTISKIDPARGKVVQTVETDNLPLGIAAAADTLYVAVRTYGRAHRGGTLRLLSPPFVSFAPVPILDPADIYVPAGDQILVITNDGLTGYRRTGGADGLQLVPDLATSLPEPTDGARTYTLQLRHGIHYSTGALVRPPDFRRALERSLADKAGPGANFFSGIVGAGGCTPKHCDLSRGVVPNGRANTVTFHLTAPDPNFLYKLAQPTAFAVPADTPLKAPQGKPLPATGPYMFARYDPKHGVRLVRNPHFREWSAGAQPDGYPNEIVWSFDGSTHAAVDQVRAVERGKGDFAYGGVPASLLSEVETRFAGQTHLDQVIETDFFVINTRLRPFNDVRARQALNYALDRNRLAATQSPRPRPSCQVLPPGMFGYRRYCPYTRDPRPDGRYRGPDLAKAKQLVAASGSAGRAITVWARRSGGTGSPLVEATYVASVLRSLGYVVRIQTKSARQIFTLLDKPRNRLQLALAGGWLPDYPSPFNFFSLLFSCASSRQTPTNNPFRFCDRRIDAEMAQASAIQPVDPQRAALLWSKVDHDVVDQAPFVSLWNTRVIDFVSRRVGNYQYNPQWGALLDQLWVR